MCMLSVTTKFSDTFMYMYCFDDSNSVQFASLLLSKNDRSYIGHSNLFGFFVFFFVPLKKIKEGTVNSRYLDFGYLE